MNIVFIMTDTQNTASISAYQNSYGHTPNVDRLCSRGVRFDRAYTTCPLCTPARGGIFSGMVPATNGATYNDATPFLDVPLMGTLFSERGFRVGYTGKWHLDGGFYNGYGRACGGFPQQWWYDGACFKQDIGDETFARHKGFGRLPFDEKLARAPRAEDTWAYRVADRALDFLSDSGDQPFLLSVSFDEPHGPYVCPREFLEAVSVDDIEMRPNFNASVEGKPRNQQAIAGQHNTTPEDVRSYLRYYLACNSFVDSQIGRVLDAIDYNNTLVIFTSDHGEMMASHGLWSKGPEMYDEITRVPFVIAAPGVSAGTSGSLASHLDIIPTMLDLADCDTPAHLHGRSLAPVLEDNAATVNEMVPISYTRFGSSWQGARRSGQSTDPKAWFPIRCAVGERYKLSVNLHDTDELYNMQDDPYEMRNVIDDPAHAAARDELHATLLESMSKTNDPERGRAWAERPWAVAKSSAIVSAGNAVTAGVV